MTILLGTAAGAMFGIVLICLILDIKGKDICVDCPYKHFYIDSITEEINNG